MNSAAVNESASAPTLNTFDYSGLPDDTAEHARKAAQRIRRQGNKVTEGILAIGRDLISVKAMLAHGEFGAWIVAELGMAERTARQYMAAAGAFDGKTATVADLAPTTVYALAAAPEETRTALVTRLEAGERMSEASIKDALWDAREERKKAAADAKLTPTQRKAKATRARKDEAERQQRLADMGSRNEARQLAIQRAAALIVRTFDGDTTGLIALLEAAEWFGVLIDAIRVETQ